VILRKHIPISLYNKLKKYVGTEYSNPLSCLSWTSVKEQLDKINIKVCAQELLDFLTNTSLHENNVKIFHIASNSQSNQSQEPTHSNTKNLVYRFLLYIYQRNIVASIIKYILLQPMIQKLELSQLTKSYKGIFSNILQRLKEIIFECVLTSFNGSNYDNYLIINCLVIILTNLKQKISIFKKNASISTIHIKITSNLPHLKNIGKDGHVKKQTKKSNDWLMSLFFKDIRYLVSANMSLDQTGKLFNLPICKLSFPYEQATSIKRLKSLDSLYPHNEQFWTDIFTGKTIAQDDRIHAQSVFDANNFTDLYEYSTYYLSKDCLLLHSIVLTLFHNYLRQSINIFLRRNFTISNLSFQQCFVIDPSENISQTLAPKRITHTYCNYFTKLAVTGGLCTSFVHGDINHTTLINEHLNYVTDPQLDTDSWPNFKNLSPWTKKFSQTPSGITTIDIRSLYPSASLKKIPVGTPLLYNRFTKNDAKALRKTGFAPSLYLKGFCDNVQDHGNHQSDVIKLTNKPPRFYHEFNALQYYLKSLPSDINIIRFQSNFTALGQVYFTDYPVDGYLAFTKNDHLYIKLIQYQSTYIHGHMPFCSTENDEKNQAKALDRIQTKQNIIDLYNHYLKHFQLTNVSFEYVEISNCDFESHVIPNVSNFMFPYKKQYTYCSFLENIYNKTLTGFLVVKNLEIKKNNQNPLFGFIIQKVEYELKHLSHYTQMLLKRFISNQRVISLHKSSEFMVISTNYFIWLHKTFGFQNTPDIYHAMLFQMDYYLKDSIETKLTMRKELKEKIKQEQNKDKKQVLEIQAELLKLMLNSCYGFTLCNITSSKFKCFKNTRTIPTHKKRLSKLKTSIQLAPNVFLNEYLINIQDPFETVLGHVGSSILFNSKVILLKRLYFLLRFLNPTCAQLLYMDTDSAHFLLKEPNFVDNVDENIRHEFILNVDKHFESGPKISGVWVNEGFYTSAQYIGEKSYILRNSDQNTYLTHMKGLNRFFQKQFIEQNIDIKNVTGITYNIFYKSPDYTIFKSSMSKDIFSNYIPIKRYFISASGSLPLKL
jgi:hypothetical protein